MNAIMELEALGEDHGGTTAWAATLGWAQKHGIPTVASLKAIDIHRMCRRPN